MLRRTDISSTRASPLSDRSRHLNRGSNQVEQLSTGFGVFVERIRRGVGYFVHATEQMYENPPCENRQVALENEADAARLVDELAAELGVKGAWERTQITNVGAEGTDQAIRFPTVSQAALKAAVDANPNSERIAYYFLVPTVWDGERQSIPANSSAGGTSSPAANLKIVSSVGFRSPLSIRATAVWCKPAAQPNCSCVSPRPSRMRATFEAKIARGLSALDATGAALLRYGRLYLPDCHSTDSLGADECDYRGSEKEGEKDWRAR